MKTTFIPQSITSIETFRAACRSCKTQSELEGLYWDLVWGETYDLLDGDPEIWWQATDEAEVQ